MTLSAVLFPLALVLLGCLASYWLLAHALVLLGALGRLPRVTPSSHDRGEIAVIIPARQEGLAVADTVRTVLHQDYQGPVTVVLVLDDLVGETARGLMAEFRVPVAANAQRLSVEVAPGRRLLLSTTSAVSKHAKLNAGLAAVTAPFVAILDADHRAHPQWLSAALTRLQASGAAAVQASKRPADVHHLPQIWEALLAHVGHEALQRAFSGLGLCAFFTGSTALFRREVLCRHGFAPSITEDTFLSYSLLLAQERIAYEPSVGSYEELPPNLASFVARRRRWSAGHTHAFVTHLPALLRSGLPLGHRLQLVAVGLYYLLPLVAILFFTTQALYYFLQLTPRGRLGVLAVAGTAGLLLYVSTRRGRLRPRDAIVSAGFLLPLVAVASPWFYFAADEELFHAVLEFPLQQPLWWIQLALLAVGLLSLAVATLRLRAVGAGALLLHLATLPLLLLTELQGCLLGIADFLTAKELWLRVDRTSTVSSASVPPAVHQLLGFTRVRRRLSSGALLLVVGGLGVVLANELSARDNCGTLEAMLWPPIWRRSADAPVVLSLEKRWSPAGSVSVLATLDAGHEREPGERATVLLDGRVVESRPLTSRVSTFSLSLPAGWEAHILSAVLAGGARECSIERPVASSVVEVTASGLRVNGEPFLIKGMVPTFATARTDLELGPGFSQMKAVGVNAARFYHAPGPNLLAAAAKQHMLLVVQPERSTWENVDLESSWQRERLIGRFASLDDSARGSPFVLLLGAGNELELGRRGSLPVRAVGRYLEELGRRSRAVPLSYSTYLTYADYPVDLLGINMLDSGSTYWQGALDSVAQRERPFYASELGGFVAFFERTPPVLRAVRLRQQWAALLAHKAQGAVLFSSHDNRAQASPPGTHNDPFVAEMPDDLRGFWDEQNQPKAELAVAAELLSDLEVKTRDDLLAPSSEVARLLVKNRRAYALRDLEVGAGGAWVKVGALLPGSETEITLPLSLLRAVPGYPRLTLVGHYHTHAGLRGESQMAVVLPEPGPEPLALIPSAKLERRGDGSFRAVALDESVLELALPESWPAVQVAGRTIPRGGGRIELALPPAFQPVGRPLVCTRGEVFEPFVAPISARGRVRVRFDIPPVTGSPRLLVLTGMGAFSADLRVAGGRVLAVAAHPYRETIVDLDALAVPPGRVELEWVRLRTTYLEARSSPSGKAIPILLEPPTLFIPPAVDLTRAP